jgi:hypothetical protein
MADEEIPENVDLRFLATQMQRLLAEFAEMRTADHDRDATLNEIRTELAEMRTTDPCDCGVIRRSPVGRPGRHTATGQRRLREASDRRRTP